MSSSKSTSQKSYRSVKPNSVKPPASCTSEVSRGSTSRNELARELKLAKLKIKRLELEADAAKRIEKIKSGMLKGVQLLEDEENSVMNDDLCRPPSPQPSERMDAVRTYVESLPDSVCQTIDDFPVKEPELRIRNMAVQRENHVFETAQLLQTCMSLPTRRTVQFDGNPMNYFGFIRNFQSTVAKYNRDPACLLDYLISACTGEAEEAIRRCTVLDPSEGYQEALRILEHRFGEPHVIARKCIDELTEGPPLKSTDTKALLRLADEMKLCSATLRQLNYQSDLNACRTLSAIVQRLPHQFQLRWFERASTILKSRREPTFDELADFISDRGDAAVAGLAYTSRPRASTTDPRKMVATSSSNDRMASIMSTRTAPESHTHKEYQPNECSTCNGSHYLNECPSFLKMSVADRYNCVKGAKLCFLCMKPNHVVKQCRSRRSCGVRGCGGQHHPLLHRLNFPEADVENLKTPDSIASVGHMSADIHPKVHQNSFAILPVRIRGSTGDIVVNAFLDSGSDTTLIDSSLLTELGLNGISAPLTVKTLNGECTMQAKFVSLELLTADDQEVICVRKAWSVSQLPKLKPINLPKVNLQVWEHLKEVQLPPTEDSDVRMLIGTDVPKAHWVLEQRTGGSDDPIAVRGPLGWVILGPVSMPFQRSQRGQINHIVTANDVHESLEKMFNFEFVETNCVKRAMSEDDKLALSHMNASTRLVDGHYEIALPWRPGAPCLPDNRGIAMRRLMALKKRLSMNEQFKSHYTTAITDYLTRGYAELVPETEQNLSSRHVWYLPHHGVYKHGDQTKVRVVFDCAAVCERTSLNQQLYTGPDLVNSLCGVLLRFREHRYTLVADIEAMFHQVKVPPTDRDSLRFLWWPEGDLNRKPKVYRMTSHPFGATSSPSCASLALRKTIDCHMAKYGTRMIELAKSAFYVDDCLLSLQSVQEVEDIAKKLHLALSKGGFNLTKFFSNVPDALSELPQAESRVLHLDLQSTESRRTLGVEWDSNSDCLLFNVAAWEGKFTRRELLSYVASLYDPLGLVAPSLLPAKLLIQDLCRRRAEWDDEMSPEEQLRWQACLLEIQAVKVLRITRCVQNIYERPVLRAELHAFSDASEVGYGAAVYLRLLTDRNEASCSLILAKSRVAPLKTTSIPRLELAAAVIAVKLVAFAKEELSITTMSTTFWTDSLIVLQLIRNTKTRFETFIANRLAVIRDHSEPDHWAYIDTKRNPADLASRGTSSRRPITTTWFQGPEFLLKHPAEWPVQPPSLSSMQPEMTDEVHVNASQTTAAGWIQQFNKAKCWLSLLRQLAWLHRFCLWFRQNRCSATNLTSMTKHLTPSDLQTAEVSLLQLVQEDAYHTELQSLPDDVCSSTVSRGLPGRLRKLHPFKHEGLLRVGGRLRWAPLPFESKHPVILPSEHFVTKMLVQYYHEINGHAGTLYVLAALRERYWITHGHSTVKSVIRKCYHCRRWHSRPGNQIMAPLPEDRMLTGEPPFTAVGVDYFGPFLVKRGRGVEKRYGCIFTCLSMRAVHLEVAHTLDTDSFLSAFTRFVARRGNPKVIYSDNGTNFRGAEADLKACLASWNQGKITKTLCNRNCDWVFTPPKASHRGGIWERMIRSVRRILLSMLADQLVSDEVLLTTLCEVERILNDRPLTRISDDPEDYSAITPNHLLLLRGLPADTPHEVNSMSLTRRWRQAQRMADTFWSRWLKDYLPGLQKREKWEREKYDLKVGDLVLLVDTHSRRGMWPKGIVEKELPGRDGRIREVLVRTSNGTLRRDVRQLCLLEANAQSIPCRSHPSTPGAV